MIDRYAFIRRAAERDVEERDEECKEKREAHQASEIEGQEQGQAARQIFYARFLLQLAKKPIRSRPRKQFEKFLLKKGKVLEEQCKVVVARDEEHAKELIYNYAQTRLPKRSSGCEMGIKYLEFKRRY